MRLVQLAGGAVVALFASLLLLTPAVADDTEVGEEGDGFIEGFHTYSDSGSASQDRSGPGGDGSPDEDSVTGDLEDEGPIPVTNCDRGPDGELLTPWDCPVEPAEVFDRDTAEQVARRLVVRLQLPTPTPRIGPDPDSNEWHMAVVGYPLWLWTDGPRTVTATESAYGRTFTLKARQTSTTFALGDGHSLTCEKTSELKPSVRPGTPSPTCGYAYQRPSKGSYTITATTHWTVTWSVAGFSGTLPGTHSATRELKVGELQALVTA